VTKGGEGLEGGDVRHLYGTALAIAMAAVMFFGGAWGYLRLLKLPVPPGQLAALPAGGGSLLADNSMLLGLAALLGTAVLAGLLVMLPRVSPLAAGLPGLVLLAWTGLYLASVRRAVTFIPLRSHAFGAGWEALLFNGVLGAAGAVMVLPLFVPSRWRAYRPADVPAPDLSVPEVPARDLPARDTGGYPAPVAPASLPRRRPEEEPELVGTVLPGSVKRVDTTRITGASRALRNTGSFRADTGAVPRAAGSSRADTAATPRTTGSFQGGGNPSLLGRPYVPPADERPYPPGR
jgi:hypothetical protein